MHEQLALVPHKTDRGNTPSQAQYFLGYSGWTLAQITLQYVKPRPRDTRLKSLT